MDLPICAWDCCMLVKFQVPFSSRMHWLDCISWRPQRQVCPLTRAPATEFEWKKSAVSRSASWNPSSQFSTRFLLPHTPANGTVSVEVSSEKQKPLWICRTGSLMQESSYTSDGEVESQTVQEHLRWARPLRKLEPQMEKNWTLIDYMEGAQTRTSEFYCLNITFQLY